MVFIIHIVVFFSPNLDTWVALYINKLLINFFDDAIIQLIENLLNVDPSLGRAFQEVNSVFLGELHALLIANLSILFLVALIADQYEEQIFMAKGLGLLEPLHDMVEAFLAGDIVAQDRADSILVVAPGDGLEALLPCLNKPDGTVSQICSLMLLLLYLMTLAPNSTPMVTSCFSR